MSPRKLTEDDKQEILQLYRNSEATTSTLANSFEVSSSTISRFLKNKLSSTEYEDLIQQKRLARTPRGETTSKTKKESNQEKEKEQPAKAKKKTKRKKEQPAKGRKTKTRKKSSPKLESDSTAVAEEAITKEIATEANEVKSAKTTKSKKSNIDETTEKSIPRKRRRTSAKTDSEPLAAVTTAETETTEKQELEAEPAKLVIESKAKETATVDDYEKTAKNSLILKRDKLSEVDSSSIDNEEDDEDEENDVNLITLKEMLGEDLEDINDEDEEEDDDWEEEKDLTVGYPRRNSSFSDLEILPLSQATFPNTCYLVIDRSAELIVKPLAEFADLGDIPQNEIRERTLPVFDNHRIAKRFSHRRERVIKVPDGRMLQKTSRHLQEKGITRLLIDGQIYSLSN